MAKCTISFKKGNKRMKVSVDGKHVPMSKLRDAILDRMALSGWTPT